MKLSQNNPFISALKLVQGEVQQVGYRRRVWSIARRLSIKGYVKNTQDGNVKIVAQGDEQALERFINELKITEPPIIVDSIAVKPTKLKKSFKDFKILLGSIAEELQEGLGAGEAQLYLFRSEFRDYRNEFRDYGGEFRDFAKRTDDNFGKLEAKYGEISEKLTMILDSQQKIFEAQQQISEKLTVTLDVLRKEASETRTQLIRAVDALTELIKSKMQQ